MNEKVALMTFLRGKKPRPQLMGDEATNERFAINPMSERSFVGVMWRRGFGLCEIRPDEFREDEWSIERKELGVEKKEIRIPGEEVSDEEEKDYETTTRWSYTVSGPRNFKVFNLCEMASKSDPTDWEDDPERGEGKMRVCGTRTFVEDVINPSFELRNGNEVWLRFNYENVVRCTGKPDFFHPPDSERRGLRVCILLEA